MSLMALAESVPRLRGAGRSCDEFWDETGVVLLHVAKTAEGDQALITVSG